MEITFDGGKVITAHMDGGHIIRTDQPIYGGGEDTAPSPFDLFLASIGTCVGIFVKSFCDQRKLDSSGIKIIQNIEYGSSGLPEEITLDMKLPSDFPERYKAAVINLAELCKVKKSIVSPPVFKVITSENI